MNINYFEYRDVEEEDIPDLLTLHKFYEPKYMADDDFVDVEAFTLEAAQKAHTLTFIASTEEGVVPVGAVSFTDVNSDLSAHMHFIIRPAFIKRILKEKIFLDVLFDRFRVLRVRKLMMFIPSFNQMALKLANRIGFEYFCTIPDEVYYKHQRCDLIGYSLTSKQLLRNFALHLLDQDSSKTEPTEKTSAENKPIKRTRKPRAKKELTP